MTLGVCPYLPPCLRQGLFRRCCFQQTSWPMNSLGFSCHCLPHSQENWCYGIRCGAWTYTDSWNANAGPCSSAPSALPRSHLPSHVCLFNAVTCCQFLFYFYNTSSCTLQFSFCLWQYSNSSVQNNLQPREMYHLTVLETEEPKVSILVSSVT